MKLLKFLLSILLLAGLTMVFVACSKSDPTPATILVSAKISNLAADPPSGGYSNMGVPIGVTNKYSLFSFQTGAVVLNTDSATTKWDIGFNSTKIIVNSGTSGLGTASGQVVIDIFDAINIAPDNGYLQDNKNAVPALYAITRGSGNGWYSVNQTSNVVTPIAGKVLIFKTANGKYAKMEILSYYLNAPASPTSADQARYYTFRYVYQPDGSKSLK